MNFVQCIQKRNRYFSKYENTCIKLTQPLEIQGFSCENNFKNIKWIFVKFIVY